MVIEIPQKATLTPHYSICFFFFVFVVLPRNLWMVFRTAPYKSLFYSNIIQVKWWKFSFAFWTINGDVSMFSELAVREWIHRESDNIIYLRIWVNLRESTYWKFTIEKKMKQTIRTEPITEIVYFILLSSRIQTYHNKNSILLFFYITRPNIELLINYICIRFRMKKLNIYLAGFLPHFLKWKHKPIGKRGINRKWNWFSLQIIKWVLQSEQRSEWKVFSNRG